MDQHKEILRYIAQYCLEHKTANEKAASNHHFAQVKLLKYRGRSKSATDAYNKMASEDPEVLRLLKDGYDQFVHRYAQRIYNNHFNELNINKCPKCDGVARTPQAKQCRFCGNSWREDK